MPGFVINGKGGNGIDPGVDGTLELRRVHRWVFETLSPLDQKVLLVLKTASRPSVSFQEQEMFHNQERVYVAGQHEWEAITLTWYDVEQNPDVSGAIWDWMNGKGGDGGPFDIFESMNINPPKTYKKDATLAMVDGHGNASERWKIYHGWPQAVNWQTLDYTTSDLATIEVTYRFDRAVREV